jgi:serine/threonine-protein kinase
MIDTIPDPGTGAVLDGRYRLESMLGRGGMGRVYRAEHVGLGRPLAIKVLDPQLVGDDEARRRFEREAQTTARLRHPNCVGVTDVGVSPDGSLYLAMELVDGVTLEGVLDAQGKLPLARAIHVIRHVLRGLAHAHAQGVVHRDLKPCNIMLVHEGGDPDFAKILDFGLARMFAGGDADRITRTGIVCGTPRYMAPEQAQDRGFDPRTDLYATSVILYEMLAGRTPFEAEEALQILAMHLKDPVPRIAEVAPGVIVPPAIEEVIRRGLAKRPDDRPRSAEEMLADLDRACAQSQTIELSGSLASVIVPAATPPPLPALAAARRRVPRNAQIAGAAVASLLLIGVIAAVAGGDDEPRPTETAAAAAPVAGEEPELELEAEDATDDGADPALERAVALLRDGRARDAVDRLKELRRRRPDDGQVAYLLGRAYGRLGWPKQTIESYRDAIRLDPTRREDPQLIRDLVGLLDSKSSWQQAARVLEQEVGAPALAVLTETATHHADSIVRGRAKRIAAKID